mmetsp:Transcript_5737/g.7469  ORF Transcript_5737/g.7469 Transcript_5737/m.7469 type:complete len:335 (+) Transcript_5737:82-1086(+)
MSRLFVFLVCLLPLVLCKTSLEIALDKAFNELVEVGTWKDIVGVLDNYDQGSFCTGNADEWPLPEAEEGSDLRRVLDRGSFICAYNQDSVLTTQGGLLVLDTSDPNNPQGALVEWWAALITKVSDYYNRPLSISWDLSEVTSQGTLDLVTHGDADAACARWAMDGFYVDPYRGKLPRALAFSVQHCFTYMETSFIYTTTASTVTSFELLVQGVDGGSVKSVCTVGSANGGTTQGCSASMSQFTASPFDCQGEGSDAFTLLDAGTCGAVWAGAPSDLTLYHSFAQPALYAAGSLFRQFDVNSTECPTCVCGGCSSGTALTVSVSLLFLSLMKLFF